MTLISELKEAEALEKARSEPHLNFLPFSATDLLSAIQHSQFPENKQSTRLHFVTKGPLACIASSQEDSPIYIHQLLNHSETPQQVISLILTHELLHLRIPPAIVDGKEVMHPPEFWVAEKALCPERSIAWCWIWENLGRCLKRRPKLERIDVLRNWRRVWCQDKCDIATCQQFLTSCQEKIEDGGW